MGWGLTRRKVYDTLLRMTNATLKLKILGEKTPVGNAFRLPVAGELKSVYRDKDISPSG